MRNMRKITALCLCVLLMLSLTACNHTGQTSAAKPPTAEQLAAAQKAEQTPMRPKTWYAADLTYSEVWADFFYDEQGGLNRIETYTRNTNSIGTNTTTYRCEPQADGTTKVYRTVGFNAVPVMTLNPAGQCIELSSAAQHEYYWDEQGRLIRETWDNERNKLSWYWDENNRLTGLDRIGTDKQYLKWYRDENGDVIRMDFRHVGWATPKKEYTIEYAWSYENDEAGRLAAKTVQFGKAGDPERNTMEVIRYLYDDTGALCGVVTYSHADLMGLYPYGQMIFSAPQMRLTKLQNYYLEELRLSESGSFSLMQRNYRIVWEVVPE